MPQPKKADYVTADELLQKAANGVKERDVDCSFGRVRVRDLTGAQSILLQKGSTTIDKRGNEHIDADAATKLTIFYGLVTPSLSQGQVEEFMRSASQADITEIVKGITGSIDVPDADALEAAFQGQR